MGSQPERSLEQTNTGVRILIKMDTTCEDVCEDLSEIILEQVHVDFLPCGNEWSPRRMRGLMIRLENSLVSLRESCRNYVPHQLHPFRISLSRKPGSAISIEFTDGPAIFIRNSQFPWMNPGPYGDADAWRSWESMTNKIVPDDAGHHIVSFRMRKVPRFILMAMVDAVFCENVRNRVISSDHPPLTSILWEAFNVRIGRDQLDRAKKEYRERFDVDPRSKKDDEVAGGQERPSKKSKRSVES